MRLGSRLRAGAVVALSGDLGAGKTTLVRGMAAAFGIDRRAVTSPSFTIIAEYPGSAAFRHVDLYRTDGEEDLEGTGFWDAIDGKGVTAIEWAEKAGAALPAGTIRIRIEHRGENEREIEIDGLDEEDRDYLQVRAA